MAAIPVSVEFQHRHTLFCLMKHRLGDHLNQVLVNESNRTNWLAKTVIEESNWNQIININQKR